jgi:hypothetical protein
MTGRQILEQLSRLPDAELDYPVIAIHGSSGDSFEVYISGKVTEVTGDEQAGELLSMEPGDKYIWGSLYWRCNRNLI